MYVADGPMYFRRPGTSRLLTLSANAVLRYLADLIFPSRCYAQNHRHHLQGMTLGVPQPLKPRLEVRKECIAFLDLLILATGRRLGRT
jgi:hypothetical protein